ncbi:MAG TPA: biotin synthase BioB, partial [Candidatus Nitrosotenuis sp.]|nr:biotin synthase BioB [Candidatus Nitrosotenuis sp.]
MSPQVILELEKKVLNGQKLETSELGQLINTEHLTTLSDSANRITRMCHGNKIDVEQLANIKKNYCSEDCVFCGQSAFFNTGIDSYQLLPANEILEMAKKAKTEGAQSYCLVAAWRQPSES